MFDSFLDADVFAAKPNDPTSSSAISLENLDSYRPTRTPPQHYALPAHPHSTAPLQPLGVSLQHGWRVAVPTAWLARGWLARTSTCCFLA
jgi:hypothetical protein